jgi:hypothetical protein
MSTAATDPRPGSKTTEMWGKVVVQVVLLANALFNLGIEIDDQMALALVGFMETAYAISRGIAKMPAPEPKTEDRARRLEELLVALTVALAERSPSTGDRTPKTP